jgi:uncharacterized protein (DUF427 family)
MPSATWNGAVLASAEAADTQLVEGNVYFPPGAVDKAFLRDSATRTVCPWKGSCHYYNVVVDGQLNKDAAWYYPQTKDAAKHIEGYVAFWKGVRVEG